MELRPNDPPRRFAVGRGDIELSHVADLALEPDEQVTFVAPSGSELDVVRKSWGYYATSSLNGRLAEHGLRAALVLSAMGGRQKLFLLLVEAGSEQEFDAYLTANEMSVLAWLHDDAAASEAARRLSSD